MQFNKSRFNVGRFNTSESKTVVATADFKGSGELFTNSTRITFADMAVIGASIIEGIGFRTTQTRLNIVSYGDLLSNSVKVIIADSYLQGEGELASDIIRELFASGTFSGTSDIVARLEIKGVVTIKAKIDGMSTLIGRPIVVLNARPYFSGQGRISPITRRETPLSINILSKGDLTTRSIAIKFIGFTLDGKGEMKTKVVKVIISSADFFGQGTIEALLSKVFYGAFSFYGYGDINAAIQSEAILKAILSGSSEIIVAPYAVYRPPYIILPTRVLIEDTTTKVVII